MALRSPMAGILNLVRGMYVLVPRNIRPRAASFYNTLLQADEPAIVVEVLNGYRVKEKLPDNIGAFTTPLGFPEVIREGSDVTLVTYGATYRIALDAANKWRRLASRLKLLMFKPCCRSIFKATLKSLKKQAA